MTLTHDENFSLNLVSNTILEGVSAYHTDGNMTKIVVVTPIDGNVLETNNDFSVSEIVAVNSGDYINSEIVQGYVLATNYPNPFNPSTTISFTVPQDMHVNLSVYDINGRVVAELVNEVKSTDTYNVVWNAASNASGVYFIKLSAGESLHTQKIMLIK